MFILDRKLKTSIIGSAFLLSALAFSACNASESKTAMKVDTAGASKTYSNGKLVIDGGVTYPVKHGKTGPYLVNENAHKVTVKYGRPATKNEIKAWDIDVMPDGTGLPEGKGSVEDGDAIYEEKCLSCHGDFGSGGGGYPALSKGNAQEAHATLKNQRITPDMDGPIRVFGSYWPEASTLWWYIKTGMPHPAPMTLSTDEVYALCAYILSINEIQIDGEELDDEYVLDRAKFLKIVMPNKKGFEPNIDGPTALDDVRAYFADTKNYGNGKRCMKDCVDKTPVVHIQMEMKDALPPMSTVRDLPKETGESKVSPGQKLYEKSCSVCHASDSMGAPVAGNKADWDKVMKQGMDTVLKNAIEGKNAMPPRGGSSLTDDEIKQVIEFMSKGK